MATAWWIWAWLYGNGPPDQEDGLLTYQEELFALACRGILNGGSDAQPPDWFRPVLGILRRHAFGLGGVVDSLRPTHVSDPEKQLKDRRWLAFSMTAIHNIFPVDQSGPVYQLLDIQGMEYPKSYLGLPDHSENWWVQKVLPQMYKLSGRRHRAPAPPGITGNWFQQVKAQITIEEVLEERGVPVQTAVPGRLKAVCPLHPDVNPSFYVQVAHQTWKCFGCTKGGDVIALVQQLKVAGKW